LELSLVQVNVKLSLYNAIRKNENWSFSYETRLKSTLVMVQKLSVH